MLWKSRFLVWVVLSVVCIACPLWADTFSPLDVELNMPAFPEVGQEGTLDCTISSSMPLQGVSLKIELPKGVSLVSGSTTWTGDIGAQQSVPLQLVVKVTAAGNKTITATTFCRVDQYASFSDVDQVFFYAEPAFSMVGHLSDEVPNIGGAQCLETGEVSKPMKLAEQMKLPLQAEPDPQPCSLAPGDAADAEGGIAPAGLLTVSGRWCYYDRSDVYRPMEWVFVQLRNGSTDAVLAETWINDNDGNYTFPAVTNPGSAGFRTRVWCFHNNTNSSDGKALRVVGVGAGRTDGGNSVSPCYSVQSGVRTSGDGSYNMGTWHVINGDADYEPAFWIMMDLNKAFWWPYWWNDHTTMNGGVTVEWSSTSTHGDHNHRTDDGGNIHLKAASPNVCDVVLHEYGHEVQWDGYGQWLPTSDCPSPHYFETTEGPHCAWYEGFANWYKFAVSNDPVYHWAGGGSLDCENSTWGNYWDDGDLVEGRVAGAMWDIGDSNVDGIDTCNLSWEYIWDTWYGSANRDNTFAEFWTRWKNKGQPKHHPLKALYQCTIDYNSWPTFSGLPDRTMNEDATWNNAIDLWVYASDPDSSDSELEYAITGNTDPNCGVTIDAGDYVDINPVANWSGTSTVTISCSDGIRTRYDSFIITVNPVNDAPTISGIPDRTVLEDGSWNNAIDLWAYANDPETSDSGLTFTIVGNTNTNCGVSIDSNRYIDIYPTAGWSGYSDVTVRVADPSGATSSDVFRVTVTSVNDTPVFTTLLPDRYMNEDAHWDNAIDLWAYVTDETPDADLVFTITGNTNTNCGVSIDSGRYIDINPVANWNGTSDVTVRCTDTGGLWREDTFRITVYAINDPPTLAYLPDKLVAKDSSNNNAIDLWVYTDDEETSDSNLVYTISGNTDPNCGVSIDDLDYVDITPTAGWTGYSDVTIRATDEGGLWAEDTFRVISATFYNTISQARANPNGTWVAVESKVTTGAFPTYYYIEEPNRTSGIRVAGTGDYGPGYTKTVAGVLGTNYAERYIEPYYSKYTGEGIWVQPLGLTNDGLGGKSPDAYTPSVPEGATDLYNVGLLVRATGRVIQHAGGGRFFIDDGSSTIDNTTNVPSVLVYPVPSAYQPPVGSYVTITGISGASTLSGMPMRILRPRSDADIQIRHLNAAFVYYDAPADAQSFKNLLDANSVSTDLIYIKSLLDADWSKYHVVIIGSDTGTWSLASMTDPILSANTPIVALGAGGSHFLDAVTSPDLYLGWLHSWSGGGAFGGTYVGGDILAYPFALPYGLGDNIGIYGRIGSDFVALYDPEGVTNRMLRQYNDQTHYVLASEQDRFYQWGFYGSPSIMTKAGTQLFVNLVYSTVR